MRIDIAHDMTWLATAACALLALAAALAPMTAGAQTVVPGPGIGGTSIPLGLGGNCTTGQSNNINGQIGLTGPQEIQDLCVDGVPGKPGDLKGFAFRLNACITGGIETVAINFRFGEPGDRFYLYIWRDLDGLPNDTCGLEAHVSIETVQDPGEFFSIYSLCDSGVFVQEGERFFVGVVYYAFNPMGPDFMIGRNQNPNFPDNGFVNESGLHGDWVDLGELGFPNRFGVFVSFDADCAAVAVEESSWGAVKALLR